MPGEAKSSSSTLTIVAVVLGLVIGGLGGCQVSQRSPDVVFQPGDSPIVIVGGSITAHSAMGWTGATGLCASAGYPPSNPCSYVSLSPTLLSQLTLVGATGFSGVISPTGFSGATALTQNWRIDVVDRNQNSPDTVGVRICSASNCSLGALGSTGAMGPVYVMPIGATGAFFGAMGPQDATGSTDQGLRFLDLDTVSGATGPSGLKYCGILPNGVVADPDWCERMHIIRLVVGVSGATGATGPLTYDCPDGACRIEVGVYPAVGLRK